MRPKSLNLLGPALGLLLLISAPADADWRWNIFAGAALNRGGDISLSGPAGPAADPEADTADSVALGGRAELWSDGRPWMGIALDGSMFFADTNGEEINLYTISPLVLFRKPPGRNWGFLPPVLEPYAAIGPGIFISNANIVPGALGVSAPPGKVSDTGVDLGLDVRAGMRWRLMEDVALFGEYRYTRVEPKFEDDLAGERIVIEAEFETHFILVGVSYLF